jgi:hypothetical protein
VPILNPEDDIEGIDLQICVRKRVRKLLGRSPRLGSQHYFHQEYRLLRWPSLPVLPAPDRDASALAGEAEAGSEAFGGKLQSLAEGADLDGRHVLVVSVTMNLRFSLQDHQSSVDCPFRYWRRQLSLLIQA